MFQPYDTIRHANHTNEWSTLTEAIPKNGSQSSHLAGAGRDAFIAECATGAPNTYPAQARAIVMHARCKSTSSAPFGQCRPKINTNLKAVPAVHCLCVAERSALSTDRKSFSLRRCGGSMRSGVEYRTLRSSQCFWYAHCWTLTMLHPQLGSQIGPWGIVEREREEWVYRANQHSIKPVSNRLTFRLPNKTELRRIRWWAKRGKRKGRKLFGEAVWWRVNFRHFNVRTSPSPTALQFRFLLHRNTWVEGTGFNRYNGPFQSGLHPSYADDKTDEALGVNWSALFALFG